MGDYYEVDFLQVHSERSGDAIAIRHQIGQYWYVHVVDGGYNSTAPVLAQHIRGRYGTNTINNVVVTHPDKDHAEGLAPILEEFNVGALWMLRPWEYAQFLLPYFARYNSAQRLAERLREDYPYIAALEEIAVRRGILIREPFQGEKIGPFTVLAPSPRRYLQLVINSDKTPQPTSDMSAILAALLQPMKKVVSFVKAGWGSEKFSSEDTSNENEMSVVQFAYLNADTIVLTGDAGRSAMTEAATYAPQAKLFLPGVSRFQAPHHGGRRNVSTAILDQWLGHRLAQKPQPNTETFIAIISSAKEDTEHPRKAVLRGLLHRGAKIMTTEDAPVWIYGGDAPARSDYVQVPNVPYPDEQED